MTNNTISASTATPKTKKNPEYPPFPTDPDALVRLPQILAVLPIGRTTFLKGIKLGEFPAPIRRGRSVLWRASEIRDILHRIGEKS